MHATLFALVVAEDPEAVFAWGMEIASDDYDEREGDRKAIVYVGNPSGNGSISTHTSAEAACKRWSTIVPLRIEWDVDTQYDARRQLAVSLR